MKIITRQARANEAAKRWASQYKNTSNLSHAAITVSLFDLGAEPSPDAVDAVIGNTSWTRVDPCSECGDESPAFVVEVGEEPDFESNTAYLCGRCIGALARLVAHPSAKATAHDPARRPRVAG